MQTEIYIQSFIAILFIIVKNKKEPTWEVIREIKLRDINKSEYCIAIIKDVNQNDLMM